MRAILTSPILDTLTSQSQVLLAGCGGGYDILGAIPLMVELEAAGHTVHLGSLTFSNVDALVGVESNGCGVFTVGAEAAIESVYCPEAWLAAWASARGKPRVIHTWFKSGVQGLLTHFEYLRSTLNLDAVILIDGGIDAILKGNETSLGTPAEDLASVAAVRACGIPHRLIACLGLGAELRDGIPHAQVFERISEITRQGGYLGSSGLIQDSEPGRAYREAVEFVFSHQQRVHRSHVHEVVLRAMAGEFGALAPDVWLSPLLNMFWFFELDVVADTHLFLEHLTHTRTIGEITMLVDGLHKSVGVRPKTVIPI